MSKLFICLFRYTLPDDTPAERYTEICEKAVSIMLGDEIKFMPHTIGVETGWLTGKPHIHLHFMTECKDVRNRVRNFKKYMNDERKGNGVVSYTPKPFTDFDNINWVFRYPLKQCGDKYIHLCSFNNLTDWDTSVQLQLATDEYERKKRECEKKAQREKDKEEREAELDTHMHALNDKCPFTSGPGIYKAVLEYYKNEKGSINPQHAWGKVLAFCVDFGILTLDDIATREWSKRW